MSILTAKVSPVPLGNITVEGLLLETGEFAIACRQASSLFQVLPNSTQKWLQSCLGKDCSYYQVKTNREHIENKRIRSTENALSLLQFEKLLMKLDRSGNKQAQNLRDDLVGLSLVQLFSDAFDIAFTKEDRQEWLILRQQSKDLYHELTPQIKRWFELTKDQRSERLEIYCMNTFKAINSGLFGKSATEIKKELGLKNKDLTRDSFNPEALRRVSTIQQISITKMKKEPQLKPVKAVNFALDVSGFDVLENYSN
jgi:hypothetical protein